MTLACDQTLRNRYRVVSLLKQEGIKSIYRAWDTRLHVHIALKEMIPQPGLDQQTLTQLRHQFQLQAMVLARLSHPHIVRATDFFEEGGNVYIAMDFVEGESLAERIEQQGTLPVEEVLVWADQLLDALAYCHSQGVIHLDIEPQSIMIQSNGQAVLVGFGLVKVWDPNTPHPKVPMWERGAPEYVPPEQHMGYVDPRSDIYSLGATIYHTLTGQAPPTATMRIASPGIFQPLRALNPHISSAIEMAVLRAMELSPEYRFHTAQEMAVTLRASLIITQGRVLVRAIEAIGTIEPNGWFKRKIARFRQAVYKRRLQALVVALPDWVTEEILSASQHIGEDGAVVWWSED